MNLKKAKSYGFLAWHVVLHYLSKVTKRPRPDLRRFFAYYGADHIFAISPESRVEMPRFSDCYACRLCDSVCPELPAKNHALAPSFLVTSFSRSLTDYVWFSRDDFECGDCHACETACPQNVPIKSIILQMHAHSQPAGVAR